MEFSYHVHVYKVREMAEVNVKADDKEAAFREAKRLKDGGKLRFRKPDYRTIYAEPGGTKDFVMRDYNNSVE